MMKSEEYKKYLKRIKRNNILVLLTQILIVVIFIVFWQIMADKNMVDTFLVSSPKKIFTSIVDLIKANNFWNHIFTTVYEIIISFILGNVIGLLVASILWFNKFLARVFEPFLTILNSLPKVALGPLIIIWAGANIKSIIIMSLLISAIISIINIYNAFKSTDENKIKIINCYEIVEFNGSIEDILDKHDKILNTSGEKEINEIFIDYKRKNIEDKDRAVV